MTGYGLRRNTLTTLHDCLAGKAPADVPDAEVRQTFVDNLKFAAAALKENGPNLLIEPVNRFDVPGFWLNTSALALSVMDEVGADNLFLQYDVHHMQRSEGELGATLAKHLARIGHIQVADNPGRNEPGMGEINYGFLFDHLDKLGYKGSVGCEYKPATTTEVDLAWLEKARQQLRAST